LALENSGSILRGRFTGLGELEWCDRRLLARIHRMTLEGLRRQIAPVPPEQFIRFLTRWQHVRPGSRLRGESGLLAIIEQLEGFSAPAAHWERFLLPSRLDEYAPHWLDDLTFRGQIVWGRLNASAKGEQDGRARPMKAFTRSTPIALMIRDHVGWLQTDGVAIEDGAIPQLGSNAQDALEAFRRHGALFPGEIGSLLQLVPAQIDAVLGELAAAGLVTSDGFPALRTLLASQSRRGRRRAAPPSRNNGRWTLLRPPLGRTITDADRIDSWCRLLLRRYGVVFRELQSGESTAPSWSELARKYRRLEARGEIRSGRFVAGVGGEQFALPEAIPLLRGSGADPAESALELPATDPLNVTGRVVGAARIPARGNQAMEITQGQIAFLDRPVRGNVRVAPR
jgi:ATP-dependent Lhr-like helicase